MRTVLQCSVKAILLVGMLAACDEPASVPSASPNRAVEASAKGVFAAIGRAQPRAIEEEFTSIARDITGFAGYYYDQAQLELVIRVVGTPSAGAVTARVLQSITEQAHPTRDRLGRPYVLRLEPARFSFDQLQSWRNALSDSLFAVNEVTFVDLDEASNRITVGIEQDSVRTVLTALARRNNVPEEALGFERNSGASPASHTSLLSRIRPLQGGTQIGPDGCTMTVPAYYPARGQNVIISASHCSATEWGPDNGDQQPTRQPLAGPTFGAEIHDEEGWSCFFNGWWRRCRHAEVSAYSVTGVDFMPGDSVSFRLGRIARPTTFVLPQNSPGPLNIDDAIPYLTIVGTREFPVAGEIVDKVGLRSGWTYNSVVRTCVDREIASSWRIMCADESDLGIATGDSGSPIFRWNADNTVLFMGMISAQDNGICFTNAAGAWCRAIFSNFRQMKADMGTFTVF